MARPAKELGFNVPILQRRGTAFTPPQPEPVPGSWSISSLAPAKPRRLPPTCGPPRSCFLALLAQTPRGKALGI